MPRQLGDLEDAVMSRVWQWNRPVTVREVLEDLQRERSIAYTTVMTVMDNLHQKGWVRREVDGRAYRYTAVSTRAAYAAALMNEAWSKSDNPAAALVAFFGMMSPAQRDALEDAVRIVRRDQPEVDPQAAPGEAPEVRPETPSETEPEVPAEVPAEVPDGVPTEVPSEGADREHPAGR
ncbi:BlaI/MecI/CopY family transcriptional regulator [Streptomyces niveus]